MVKSTGSKRSLLAQLSLVMVMLPYMALAFFATPGLWGGSGLGSSGHDESSKKEPPKSQEEKLTDPWRWVSVVAFSVAMIFCLRVSFQGRWKKVCGVDDLESGMPGVDGTSLMGNNAGGGNGIRRNGNIHGFS